MFACIVRVERLYLYKDQLVGNKSKMLWLFQELIMNVSLHYIVALYSVVLYCIVKQGRQSWGFGGRGPLDFGLGRVVGGRRMGRGGRGRVVKYYILSCTGSMFESGDF